MTNSTDPVQRGITRMHQREERAEARWDDQKHRLPDVFDEAHDRIREDRDAIEALGADFLPSPDLNYDNYERILHGLRFSYWFATGGFHILVAAEQATVNSEVVYPGDVLPAIIDSQDDDLIGALIRRDSRAVGQLVVAEWMGSVIYAFMREAEPMWPEDDVREYVDGRVARWKDSTVCN